MKGTSCEIAVLQHVDEMMAFSTKCRNENRTIGFVPTMGALHEGHLSLIAKAKASCDVVVCSIFVNPTQFNDPKDLLLYPRTEEADIALLKEAGCDIVFVPAVFAIYPEGQEVQDYNFGTLTSEWEGRFRPGHFNGVITVVKRLFEIVIPHKSFFGKKDFQQFSVIREWVKRFEVDVEIVGCDTVRASSGLALSSRNKRLSNEQVILATAFSKALIFLQENKQINDVKALIEEASELFIEKEQIQLQYFTIANSETLEPLENISDVKHQVALIAGFIGGVRLIDELELN
ncbi:MAG: pantoate--beta-alanine ligase [Sediminibacterium sp.]